MERTCRQLQKKERTTANTGDQSKQPTAAWLGPAIHSPSDFKASA